MGFWNNKSVATYYSRNRKRVQLIQLGGYKLCLGMVALAFSTNVNVVKWFIMSCYYENSFYLINPLEEYWVPTRDLYTMLRNLLNNFFSWTFCISTAKLGTLCCCLVAQLCPTLLSRVQLCNPMDCRGNLPGYLCPWDTPGIEYWSGLPFPSPKDLPYLGIEPVSPSSPVLQADSLLLGLPWWLRW